MYQGIPIQSETTRATTTVGGSYVLPPAPPSPNRMEFDSVSISRDTLPARNAMNSMSEIGQRGPRPSPTMVHDSMAGAGAPPSAQGMQNLTSLPNVKPFGEGGDYIRSPLWSTDEEITQYEMRGQQITPDEPVHFRAAHTLEMYGTPAAPNMTEMRIGREEVYLDQLPTNHGVPMNFGGNPYSEKARQYIRPQPSHVRGPQYSVPRSTIVEPILSVPVRPAPPRINMPRIPRVSANPVTVQAKPVLPPVEGPDFGLGNNSSLLAGTSRHMGPIGQSSGRSFGAEGSMTPF